MFAARHAQGRSCKIRCAQRRVANSNNSHHLSRVSKADPATLQIGSCEGLGPGAVKAPPRSADRWRGAQNDGPGEGNWTVVFGPVSDSPRTPCRLCGSLDRVLVLSAPDFEYGSLPGEFQVVECSRCGHQFVDPLPSPEQVEHLYSESYYTVNERSPLYFRGIVKSFKQWQEVATTVRRTEPLRPRSILEVGCGNARRLARLAEAWRPSPRVVGVELLVSDELRRFADTNSVELIQADVERELSPLAGQTFDLIVMSQLIEHLRDPASALVRLAELLSDGGRLIIETPNRGGLDYRLFKKRYWGGYHLPRHFHLFTRNSLQQLIESTGLTVLESGFVPSPGLWIMSLRNSLRLSSAKRSSSPFEVLNFSNPLAVGAFSIIDQTRLLLGKDTSNQFVVATRRPRATNEDN